LKTSPDKCTSNFGAGILLKHIQALKIEIDGARLAKDIEYIHRMRVATRRLRSALTVFSNCFPARKIKSWTRQVKNITRALGNARDADVQIELVSQVSSNLPSANFLPGIKRLLLRLNQNRENLQSAVVIALDELSANGLLAEMTSFFEQEVSQSSETLPFTNTLYRYGSETLNHRLDEFLAFEPHIAFAERVAELHAMRIAAKCLRYEMEIFAPLYPDELKPYLLVVRKSQETLGNVHDCDMWAITLPLLMEQERQRIYDFYGSLQPLSPLVPGLKYFQENRQEVRQQEYDDFLQDWQKWKTRDIWEEFRSITRRPLMIVNRVFPAASFSTASEDQDPS
jgi:CHAD domain-containing protein